VEEIQKTHQEVPNPEITVRYLADFMGASERRRRSIVEGCKYRPIARLVQHREATVAISGALQLVSAACGSGQMRAALFQQTRYAEHVP
jgi:hypothetical protein